MFYDYKAYSPDELYAMAEKEILENNEFYKENSKLIESKYQFGNPHIKCTSGNIE